MQPDSALTTSFVETGEEAAIAEIVHRYVNLVYSAAVRQVGGDRHLAKDVTQIVFTQFVQRSASLRGRTSLSGWFYTTTHHVAANVVRSECRRRNREREVHFMETIQRAASGPDWSLLEPVLDDAMHEIKDADREVILLRYFERLPVAAVGTRLGLGENAAAKRIERALERLRACFTRRGLTSTSAALGAILEAQSVTAAPAELTAGIVSALSASAIVGVGTVGVWLTTAKVIGSFAIISGVGAGTYFMTQSREQAVPSPVPAAVATAQTDTPPSTPNVSKNPTNESQMKTPLLAIAALSLGATSSAYSATPETDLTSSGSVSVNNGVVADSVYGVSFTLPSTWSFRNASNWRGTETTVWMAPAWSLKATPSIYYHAMPKPEGSAEAILRESARLKTLDRAKSVSDYAIVPDSFVFTQIAGNPALCWRASFTVNGEPYFEYFARVLSEKMVLMMFVVMPRDELSIVKPDIDRLLSTLKMP